MEYPDLPVWAQPGGTAVNYHIGEAEIVTVTRVTKTQLVVQGTHTERRYDREVPTGGWGRSEFEGPHYRRRGSYSTYLISPDEPKARAALLRAEVERAVVNAEVSVEKLVRDRRNPSRDDKRTQAEKALHEIDLIENAARIARKKIMEALTKYGEPEREPVEE